MNPYTLSHTILFVLLIGSISPLPCFAQSNWDRFRGPNGSGISTDYEFPASVSPNEFAWNIELQGQGCSSPIIIHDRVYVTSADPEGMRYLQAFDLSSGKTLWTSSINMETLDTHAKNSMAASTPTSDGEMIYTQFSDRKSFLVTAWNSDGSQAWNQDLGEFACQHGPAASMILVNDFLIVPMTLDGPSMVVAFHKSTGKKAWVCERPFGKASYATPCLWDNGTHQEIILPGDAPGISSIDPQTGKVLWSSDTPFPERVVASPILTDNLIISHCGSGGRGKTLMSIAYKPGLTEASAKPAYILTKNLPYVVTPIYDDGLLFLWGDRGVASCVNASTGEEIWTDRIGGNFNGSPVLAAGKLYCVSEEGILVCLAADRGFEKLGETNLSETSLATPAIASGKLVVRTQQHLIAINALR